MVIMDMENGDQVAKRGCLCPQDSRGGGVSNPINPPYLRTGYVDKCLHSNIGMSAIRDVYYLTGCMKNSCEK